MTELGRWPVSLDIPVAWSDMDALGHVNNAMYLRWFESARLHYLERAGLLTEAVPTGVGPILARQSIDYARPVTYPDTVRVELTVTRFGTTSFTMAFRIHSTKLGVVAASGEGVGVLIDYRAGTTVPLDDAFRGAILALEAQGT